MVTPISFITHNLEKNLYITRHKRWHLWHALVHLWVNLVMEAHRDTTQRGVRGVSITAAWEDLIYDEGTTHLGRGHHPIDQTGWWLIYRTTKMPTSASATHTHTRRNQHQKVLSLSQRSPLGSHILRSLTVSITRERKSRKRHPGPFC